jgi:hypothetical protein
MRICIECNKSKVTCKDRCTSCYSRQWRHANRERVNKDIKRWREANPEYITGWRKANPIKVSEFRKRYYRANAKRLLEYNKQWDNDNREKRRGYIEQWKKANPSKVMQHSFNYIQKHPGRGPGRFGSFQYCEWRSMIYQKDNYTCQSCFKRGVRLHAHHIKGWADYPDLRYDIENGITLCVICHREEHKKKEVV